MTTYRYRPHLKPLLELAERKGLNWGCSGAIGCETIYFLDPREKFAPDALCFRGTLKEAEDYLQALPHQQALTATPMATCRCRR